MPNASRCRIRALLPALGLLVLAAASGGCATTSPDNGDAELHRARVHYDLAVDHLAKGRHALAIRELIQAERLDPTDPWIPLALGEAYRRKGHQEEAEAALLRAVAADPAFQQGRLNLSALYIQLGRHAEAIPHAAALAEDPTFPSPWRALTNLGWAEFKLGRLGDARRHLELATEYDPEYWPALLNLGILEAREGKPLAALQRFEQVLRLGPGRLAEAEAHFRMAEIYVSLGQRERAIEHLSAVDPGRASGQWGKRSADYLRLLR